MYKESDMINVYSRFATEFKGLKISLEELKQNVPHRFFMQCDNKTVVSKEDLENLLINYKTGKISKADLLNWVNTVWFSELFCYDELYCDCIASVMNELEEADERDDVLSELNIVRYLNALENNLELD